MRDFDAAGIGLDDLAVRRPTLDDVFLTLTGHAAEEHEARRRQHERAERHGWLYWQVSDAIVLTGRALRHIPRNPELLVFSTIQPVMFVVLFRYVLGGAIKLPPGVSYVNYLMAGVFVNTVAFGSFTTGVGLAEDLQNGPDRPLPLAADVARALC